MVFKCINLHFIDKCNYKCKHCFVKKEQNELSMNEIKMIVDNIAKYFLKYNVKGRINLAGGEPLMSKNISEIINYIYSKNIEVSLITNGHYLTREFILENKDKISCIGISIDSLDYNTNCKIGRCENKVSVNIHNLYEICKLIKSFNVKLKINTCLYKYNVYEDFADFLNIVKPDRYKVLEMSCPKESKLEELRATPEDIQSFLDKHNSYISAFESANEMKDSYVIIDSKGNISTNNLHVSNLSAIDNDIDLLIKEIGVSYINYIKRYL